MVILTRDYINSTLHTFQQWDGGVADEFWSPDKRKASLPALPITCTAHHGSVISADGRTALVQSRTISHFPSVLQHIGVSHLFVSVPDLLHFDRSQSTAGLMWRFPFNLLIMRCVSVCVNL